MNEYSTKFWFSLQHSHEIGSDWNTFTKEGYLSLAKSGRQNAYGYSGVCDKQKNFGVDSLLPLICLL